MKLLICDPASREAVDFLEKNGISADFKPEISALNLLNTVSDYDALMVRSRTKVTKEVVEKGKKLIAVGRIGSGYDNINIEECRKRGIAVINAPDANSQSVAELTLALIISLLRRLDFAISSMKKGEWTKNEIWGSELAGKTVGILGYGYVGKRVAKLLSSFGCNLLIFSKKHQDCSLDELFSRADVVCCHLSLNPEAKGIIGKSLLSKMKKEAILINISRGDVIRENDLYEHLAKNQIAGAALDVFWQEPLPDNSRWRRLKNVILTPHIGAATFDALSKAGLTVAADLVRINKGQKPEFRVI